VLAGDIPQIRELLAAGRRRPGLLSVTGYRLVLRAYQLARYLHLGVS
jgi:hypothetical protein